ncbi:hypothetical protein [Legionella sp.]|uniref:hypothetical protein n=1 Tax=Legionella sp. TaxID=459 RepID=UPI003C90F4F1
MSSNEKDVKQQQALDSNAELPNQPLQPATPTTPRPEATSDDDIDKKDDKALQGTMEKLQQPGVQEDSNKKSKKDPMQEMVDDLGKFVQETNKQITDSIKGIGQAGWDGLQNTGPMKTLNDALKEATDFMKDSVDDKMNKVANSGLVKFVSDLKDKITKSFSQVMNMGANSKAVTPSESKSSQRTKLEQGPDTATDPMKEVALPKALSANDKANQQSATKQPSAEADLKSTASIKGP